MLVACRLAGLSALEAHYAGVVALTQSAAEQLCQGRSRLDNHQIFQAKKAPAEAYPAHASALSC
jgi:hypothetical protein